MTQTTQQAPFIGLFAGNSETTTSEDCCYCRSCRGDTFVLIDNKAWPNFLTWAGLIVEASILAHGKESSIFARCLENVQPFRH